MLFLNLAVLVQAATVALQGFPDKGALCTNNRDCGLRCYEGIFNVQLNEGEVSFVCAADNPKNTAIYFIGKCENLVSGGGPGDACDSVEGQSCPESTGCLLDQGNGNLKTLNSR